MLNAYIDGRFRLFPIDGDKGDMLPTEKIDDFMLRTDAYRHDGIHESAARGFNNLTFHRRKHRQGNPPSVALFSDPADYLAKMRVIHHFGNRLRKKEPKAPSLLVVRVRATGLGK